MDAGARRDDAERVRSLPSGPVRSEPGGRGVQRLSRRHIAMELGRQCKRTGLHNRCREGRFSAYVSLTVCGKFMFSCVARFVIRLLSSRFTSSPGARRSRGTSTLVRTIHTRVPRPAATTASSTPTPSLGCPRARCIPSTSGTH
jgi:hypothetical protein